MRLMIFAVASLISITFAQSSSTPVVTQTVYSCPSGQTEYLTLTVALAANSTLGASTASTTTTAIALQANASTITETIFQSVTILQTITTTVFNVSTAQKSVTRTTNLTTTETLYPIISTFTTTKELTSLTICATHTLNPTYTANFPLPTEYTWGCPPGYLCRPEQSNCNFEAGLPADNFYCSPDQCIAASILGTPQIWNPTIYGNLTPATDPSLRFNAIDHYFNMNPQDFGLSYEVFLVEEAFTSTSTISYGPTPVVAARQAQTSVPGECYPWCNDCLLEAQSVGKSPALCAPGSTFEQDLTNCQQCIDYHKTDDSNSFVQIAPQFQQFIAYCNGISPSLPSPTIVSTTMISKTISTGFSSSISSHLITASVIPTSSSSLSTTTEWAVTSGSTTIIFHTSPSVSTEWTMTSGTSTFSFTSQPTIYTSVIVGNTATIQVPITSTTSITSVNSAVETTGSSPVPSVPAFTGVASRSLPSGQLISCGLSGLLFLILGGW